jgi:hypothetical protein
LRAGLRGVFGDAAENCPRRAIRSEPRIDPGDGTPVCPAFVHSWQPLNFVTRYARATIDHKIVKFEDKVKWISIQFDGRCKTIQVEDSLVVSVPNPKGIPLQVGKYSMAKFPTVPLLLPGNEVSFGFDTSSCYVENVDKYEPFILLLGCCFFKDLRAVNCF